MLYLLVLIFIMSNTVQYNCQQQQNKIKVVCKNKITSNSLFFLVELSYMKHKILKILLGKYILTSNQN